MERLKFLDFNICPNILHVDKDANTKGKAIAFQSALKSSHANKGTPTRYMDG